MNKNSYNRLIISHFNISYIASIKLIHIIKEIDVVVLDYDYFPSLGIKFESNCFAFWVIDLRCIKRSELE